MQVYLIRHPRTTVAPGICYGRSNVAVSSEEVARVTAALLPNLPNQAPLFSSPLCRCADLAAALVAGGISPLVKHDENLMEMDFGTWEMRAWDDIDRSAIDAWANDMTHYCPGGGESVYQMAQRISTFLARLSTLKNPDAIVVCHAGTIRLVEAWLPGVDAASLALRAASAPHTIGYGEIRMIEIPTIVCP